jgi:hypothetical protein
LAGKKCHALSSRQQEQGQNDHHECLRFSKPQDESGIRRMRYQNRQQLAPMHAAPSVDWQRQKRVGRQQLDAHAALNAAPAEE